jgi:hypothetical protein
MYYSNEQLDLDNNGMDLTIGRANLSFGHDTCHPEIFNNSIQSHKGNISTVLKLGQDHFFQHLSIHYSLTAQCHII